eukprot:13811949-Alexandrium_andersonii.AAC.1
MRCKTTCGLRAIISRGDAKKVQIFKDLRGVATSAARLSPPPLLPPGCARIGRTGCGKFAQGTELC